MREGSVRLLALAGALAAGFPAAAALATSHPAAAHIYRGPAERMRFGPVRATIVVRARRIVDVKIGVAGDIVRSRFITRRAIPELRRETLAAQSVYIDAVSGATQTSEAYIASLSVAIKQAEKAGTLPG
jgi:uncharacterized protein with FMN-binding domain